MQQRKKKKFNLQNILNIASHSNISPNRIQSLFISRLWVVQTFPPAACYVQANHFPLCVRIVPLVRWMRQNPSTRQRKPPRCAEVLFSKTLPRLPDAAQRPKCYLLPAIGCDKAQASRSLKREDKQPRRSLGSSEDILCPPTPPSPPTPPTPSPGSGQQIPPLIEPSKGAEHLGGGSLTKKRMWKNESVCHFSFTCTRGGGWWWV